jgi:hypothetical protein
VEWCPPSQNEFSGLVGATQAKYGYPASPDSFSAGTWRLSPGRVLAWNVLYQDATRFMLARDQAECLLGRLGRIDDQASVEPFVEPFVERTAVS